MMQNFAPAVVVPVDTSTTKSRVWCVVSRRNQESLIRSESHPFFLLHCLVQMCTWLEFGMSFIPSPNMHTQSQSHGKIVRKLSKRLKVGSRKATMVTMPTELVPVRPSSPVLYAARPVPLHQHSQLEQSDSGSSGNTTANSLGTCIKKDLHVCYCAFHKLS